MKRGIVKEFALGVLAGALGSVMFGVSLLFILNMANIVVLTMPNVPDLHQILAWIYHNLRLSVIPFAITLGLFIFSLLRLKSYLKNPPASPERVAQVEHFLDIWVNLFFGIGVIWTAIGIRSALISALGDLDPLTASELGAFSILRRLVEGGILLALSTTIFGAVGGYLMRVIKAFAVGAQLQAYYGSFVKSQSDEIGQTLHSIEQHLAELVRTSRGRLEEST